MLSWLVVLLGGIVLRFNHQKTIRIVCNCKNGVWKFGSIKMDPDIRAMFKRNNFVPIVNKNQNPPPYFYFSRILDFLGKNEKGKLDKTVHEEYSDTKHVAVITLDKRPTYSHSG